MKYRLFSSIALTLSFCNMLCMDIQKNEELVTTVQAAARGFLARKKYAYIRAEKFVDSLVVGVEPLHLNIFDTVSNQFCKHFTMWWYPELGLKKILQDEVYSLNDLVEIHVARAEYYVYALNPKAPQEVSSLIRNLVDQFSCTHGLDLARFKGILGKKFIVLDAYSIADDMRNQKIGTHIFLKLVQELKKRHPDFLIIGKAQPFGMNPLTLDKLCAFYEKCGCKIFNKQQKYAYFYVKNSRRL